MARRMSPRAIASPGKACCPQVRIQPCSPRNFRYPRISYTLHA